MKYAGCVLRKHHSEDVASVKAFIVQAQCLVCNCQHTLLGHQFALEQRYAQVHFQASS